MLSVGAGRGATRIRPPSSPCAMHRAVHTALVSATSSAAVVELRVVSSLDGCGRPRSAVREFCLADTARVHRSHRQKMAAMCSEVILHRHERVHLGVRPRLDLLPKNLLLHAPVCPRLERLIQRGTSNWCGQLVDHHLFPCSRYHGTRRATAAESAIAVAARRHGPVAVLRTAPYPVPEE